MLFNSIEFTIFLPIVFILYWIISKRSLKLQNGLLIIVSYVFYGWWDWRFLSLIIFSSFVDYFVGIQLSKTDKKAARKQLLLVSILVNIGLLSTFKYFNFFTQSFSDTFTLLGIPFELKRLNFLLPVGISFYTFQTLSYSIDVYRKRLPATKDMLSFFAFVSFFPQLVAGPIERATNLLPQFYKKRSFDYAKAVDGMRQILWGLVKKVVIADNCARYANQIFDNYETLNGSTLVLGAVFFAFQIYGDFSGYSDIAIGTSRLFGFNLMQNFAFPYFSRDIAEFWRRWHISLSTWFRDYLYIPLGGSRGGSWNKIRNIFIIFLVSGFWHGANWTFIAWGFLNACYFLPLLLSSKNRKNLDVAAQNRAFPSISELFQIGTTFGLTVLAWIFFRSENQEQAFSYIAGIFSKSLFYAPTDFRGVLDALKTILMVCIFVLFEWFGRRNHYAIETLGLRWTPVLRRAFYFAIIVAIFWFSGDEQRFIYFQF